VDLVEGGGGGCFGDLAHNRVLVLQVRRVLRHQNVLFLAQTILLRFGENVRGLGNTLVFVLDSIFI
jgi:hypothetical protein